MVRVANVIWQHCHHLPDPGLHELGADVVVPIVSDSMRIIFQYMAAPVYKALRQLNGAFQADRYPPASYSCTLQKRPVLG